jgi:hypothetical protein
MEASNTANTLGGQDLGAPYNASNFGATNNAPGINDGPNVGPGITSINVDAPNSSTTTTNFGNTSFGTSNLGTTTFGSTLGGKTVSFVSPGMKSTPKPVPRLAVWLAIAIAGILLVALVAVLAYFLTTKPSCAACAISGAPSSGPNGVNWVECNHDQCQGTAAISGTGTTCATYAQDRTSNSVTLPSVGGDEIRTALATLTTPLAKSDTNNIWQKYSDFCQGNKCVGFSVTKNSGTTGATYTVEPCIDTPGGNTQTPQTSDATTTWTMVQNIV